LFGKLSNSAFRTAFVAQPFIAEASSINSIDTNFVFIVVSRSTNGFIGCFSTFLSEIGMETQCG